MFKRRQYLSHDTKKRSVKSHQVLPDNTADSVRRIRLMMRVVGIGIAAGVLIVVMIVQSKTNNQTCEKSQYITNKKIQHQR